VTTFNRNFAKRADGNPNTYAFIVSPEIAVAFAFSGVFRIPEGLEAPTVPSLPLEGFAYCDSGCSTLKETFTEPLINLSSSRIQRLKPFERWDGSDFMALPLLIKTKGKCTTDHISMAGPWLQYRGHLENISGNFLLGAVDAFNGESGVLVEYPGAPGKISAVSAGARRLGKSIVVAEDNYGEGSSREHAAMEARYLGVKVIVAKSYARIHETNLKKQGVLALTFADPSDYDKVLSEDMIDVMCSSIAPGVEVQVVLNHKDGSTDRILANHTYNDQQIGWFKTGSALNCLCKK
jgi:aconitate hydratase